MKTDTQMDTVRAVGSVLLWGSSIFLSALFLSAGLTKFVVPLETLAQAWLWVGDTPPFLVRVIGVAELAGAVGILLAGGLRLWPRLGVAAAVGLSVVGVGGVVLHVLRGEYDVTLPAVAALLAAGVAYGRTKWLPIEAHPPRLGTWISGSLMLVAMPSIWFLLALQRVPGTAAALALYGVLAACMLLYNRPRRRGHEGGRAPETP